MSAGQLVADVWKNSTEMYANVTADNFIQSSDLGLTGEPLTFVDVMSNTSSNAATVSMPPISAIPFSLSPTSWGNTTLATSPTFTYTVFRANIVEGQKYATLVPLFDYRTQDYFPLFIGTSRGTILSYDNDSFVYNLGKPTSLTLDVPVGLLKDGGNLIMSTDRYGMIDKYSVVLYPVTYNQERCFIIGTSFSASTLSYAYIHTSIMAHNILHTAYAMSNALLKQAQVSGLKDVNAISAIGDSISYQL